MGLEDFDINFEKDSDEKDIRVIDDLKNDGTFNINKRDMNTKEHRNISPNLSRFMNQKKEQRKPSLGKSVPLGDLDMLINTKKSNISSDEDTSSDVSDNYQREEEEDEDEVSQMYSNKDDEDDEDENEDDGEDEISYNKDNNDYEEEEKTE